MTAEILTGSASAACSAIFDERCEEITVCHSTDVHAGKVFRLTLRIGGDERTLIAKSYKDAPGGVFSRDCAPYEWLSPVCGYFPRHFIDSTALTLYQEDLGQPLWPRLARVDRSDLAEFTPVIEGLAGLHATSLSHVPAGAIRRVALTQKTHLRWVEPVKILGQFVSNKSNLSGDEMSKTWDREVLRLEEEFGPAHECLLHTDFHLGNVFIIDGRMKVIDMPGLNSGPPEIDLAKLLSRIGGFEWPDVLILMDQYLRASDDQTYEDDHTGFLNRFLLRWVLETMTYAAASFALRTRPRTAYSDALSLDLDEVDALFTLATEALRTSPKFSHLLDLWTALTDGRIPPTPRQAA